MRWKTLGDVTRIRSAVFYKRYQVPEKLFDKNETEEGVEYIPSPLLRKPYKVSVLSRSINSDLSSFLEYDFKYKVDKGILSSFTFNNMIDDYTNDMILLDKDGEVSQDQISMMIPERSLIMQETSDLVTRGYDYFNFISLGSYSEMFLDIEGDQLSKDENGNIETIRISDGIINGVEEFSTIWKKIYGPSKIEFYDEVITDVSNFKHEYIEELYTEGDRKPVLIVEFGPEVSYEREDYQYKSQMPEDEVPPHERTDYLMELEEFSNRKFLYITISSDEDEDKINLSLKFHLKESNPHRNQKDFVLRNDDWRSISEDESVTESLTNEINNQTLIFDKRSNTLLGSMNLDRSKFIILKDKIDRASTTTLVEYGRIKGGDDIVRVTDENRDNIETIVETQNLKDYKRFLVYNYGDRVLYNGVDYQSIMNGNLGENPVISPFWIEYSPDDFYIPPFMERVLIYIRNISDDENSGCISDPDGEQYVIKGGNITIKCNPAIGYHVFKATLNGEDIQVSLDNIISIDNIITGPNNVLIYYKRSEYTLNILINPDNVEGLIATGAGKYDFGKHPILYAESTNIDYSFQNWTDESGIVVSSKPEETEWKLTRDTTLTANFKRNIANIKILLATDGGSLHFNSRYVNYGDDLSITFSVDPGFEADYVIDNGDRVFLDNDSTEYVLRSIHEDHTISLYLSRHKSNVMDSVVGRINYVTIGEYDWSMRNLEFKKLGINPFIDGEANGFGFYYRGYDMNKIDLLLRSSGSSGFHVPSTEEWNSLISSVGGNNTAGKSLKSTNKFNSVNDKNGWIESNNPGTDSVKFTAFPSGHADIYNELPKFINSNRESKFWTSSIDRITNSSMTVGMTYNADNVTIVQEDMRSKAIPIRLCRRTPSAFILGDVYKYRKLGNLYWTTSNLAYNKLGSYYDDLSVASDNLSGRLYSFNEVEEINKLLSEEGLGFRIPTDEDWKDLERFLGLMDNDDINRSGYRGIDEGKLLKINDDTYGKSWNDSDSIDLLSFNSIPDGYYDYRDGYVHQGEISKYWTSTNVPDINKSYCRSLSHESDKIGRFLEDYNNKLSIRLVKNA